MFATLTNIGCFQMDEYGKDDVFSAMLTSFVEPTFALLNQEKGLQNNPDTVDDFFRLCTRFALCLFFFRFGRYIICIEINCNRRSASFISKPYRSIFSSILYILMIKLYTLKANFHLRKVVILQACLVILFLFCQKMRFPAGVFLSNFWGQNAEAFKKSSNLTKRLIVFGKRGISLVVQKASDALNKLQTVSLSAVCKGIFFYD